MHVESDYPISIELIYGDDSQSAYALDDSFEPRAIMYGYRDPDLIERSTDGTIDDALKTIIADHIEGYYDGSAPDVSGIKARVVHVNDLDLKTVDTVEKVMAYMDYEPSTPDNYGDNSCEIKYAVARFGRYYLIEIYETYSILTI